VIENRRDQAWFALMLRAGLRVGEVASLRREDVLSPAQADQPARLRVCCSIDDWIYILKPDIIEILVKEVLPKLGTDGFYELS